MGRKNVTIPYNIFKLLKRLSNEDRLIAYDTILNRFFENEKIDYDSLPERVVDVLIVGEYDMRRIQSQYENGRVKKNDPVLSCKNSESQIQPNSAKFSQNFSSDYYNIIYNILNKYIYNNQSVSNNNINNKELKYLNINNKQKISQSIANIEKVCDKKTMKKMSEAMKQLDGLEVLKINGVAVSKLTALDNIFGLLLRNNAGEQIKFKIESLGEIQNLKSPTNYLISSLYNLSIDLEKQDNRDTKSHNLKNKSTYMKHEYTPTQLKNLYDDLDEVEI